MQTNGFLFVDSDINITYKVEYIVCITNDLP